MTQNEPDAKILEVIDVHLQEVNDDQALRLSRIDGLIDFLQYQRRLTALSDEEREDYGYTLQGYPLTDEQRKIMDDCKSEKARDYYVEMWARSTYFRRCAWQSYLFGQTTDKPSV